MTPVLLRPIAAALHHERRRRAQLPPLVELTPDEAMAIVLREETRRAAERAMVDAALAKAKGEANG